MKSILSGLLKRKKGKGDIVIVSGLPRCGTSVMMQMLRAGGVDILTDNVREADRDNPKGYYELEKVKKIKEDASWLERAYGKAFKMVSMLLYDLPADKRYRVIFMKRDLDEMIASQKRMLKRLGKDEEASRQEEMKPNYEKHLRDIEDWLSKQGNFEVLYVSYNNLLKDTKGSAQEIGRFLGNRVDVDNMMKVVDKSLYRNKKKA